MENGKMKIDEKEYNEFLVWKQMRERLASVQPPWELTDILLIPFKHWKSLSVIFIAIFVGVAATLISVKKIKISKQNQAAAKISPITTRIDNRFKNGYSWTLDQFNKITREYAVLDNVELADGYFYGDYIENAYRQIWLDMGFQVINKNSWNIQFKKNNLIYTIKSSTSFTGGEFYIRLSCDASNNGKIEKCEKANFEKINNYIISQYLNVLNEKINTYFSLHEAILSAIVQTKNKQRMNDEDLKFLSSMTDKTIFMQSPEKIYLTSSTYIPSIVPKPVSGIGIPKSYWIVLLLMDILVVLLVGLIMEFNRRHKFTQQIKNLFVGEGNK